MLGVFGKPAYPGLDRIEILRAKRFVNLAFVELHRIEATANKPPEPSNLPEGRRESDVKSSGGLRIKFPEAIRPDSAIEYVFASRPIQEYCTRCAFSFSPSES